MRSLPPLLFQSAPVVKLDITRASGALVPGSSPGRRAVQIGIVAVWTAVVGGWAFGQGEVGVGLFPFEGGGPKDKKEEKTSRNPMVIAIAQELKLPEKAMEDLHQKGYGYWELIRLGLLAQKSGKPLADVVKLREEKKRKPFRTMAERLKVNYEQVLVEAHAIRHRAEAKAPQLAVELSTTTAPATTGQVEGKKP